MNVIMCVISDCVNLGTRDTRCDVSAEKRTCFVLDANNPCWNDFTAFVSIYRTQQKNPRVHTLLVDDDE